MSCYLPLAFSIFSRQNGMKTVLRFTLHSSSESNAVLHQNGTPSLKGVSEWE